MARYLRGRTPALSGGCARPYPPGCARPYPGGCARPYLGGCAPASSGSISTAYDVIAVICSPVNS